MTSLYLGVDGGQSSTTALIADSEGRIIGHGRGGPCNHLTGAEGKAKFLQAVGICLEEACRQAGLDSGTVEFSAACLGLSGGGEDKEAYARELIRSAKFKITNDAEIALSGATGGMAGIIVIAGTGSIALGRNSKNTVARAGGWGYIFGDEGGAFDLTRQALRAALQHEEGWGPSTILRERLLLAAQAKSANELLHRFYTPEYPRHRVASFSQVVSEAAESGDTVAREILSRAAANLVRYTQAVYHQLFSSSEDIVASYMGGVFRSRLLRAEFEERVRSSIHCRTQPPRFGPAAGAVLDALHLDGNESDLRDVPESEK